MAAVAGTEAAGMEAVDTEVADMESAGILESDFRDAGNTRAVLPFEDPWTNDVTSASRRKASVDHL
jgi:hypothetical protein